MSLFKRLLSRGGDRDRLFLLGMDGVSLAMAGGEDADPLMPNLAGLLKKGALAELETVIPTLSRVAWPTFAAGMNPGKHGVFGFVDRGPNPFQVHIPDARSLKTAAVWETLGRAGKRVGVMNVPLTYPPKAVNGFMVADSTSPDLAGATFPVELAPRLMEMDYRLEADTSLALNDTAAFVEDLGDALGRRFTACFKMMRTEAWHFFQLNLTGTDRINHFLWADYQAGEGVLSDAFTAFYRKLDSYLGELLEELPKRTRLAVMSPFGFTQCQAHLYVNHWLEKNGYLLFGRGKRGLLNMHPDSKAYSLVPGRIFINLQGREERGSVQRGRDYEDLREELIHRLGGLSHPETGGALIQGVYKREMLYSGNQISNAADLIIEPAPGYDLKASLDGADVLGPPDLSGMHAKEGAFFFLKGAKSLDGEEAVGLVDIAPTILSLLGVAVPANLEGRPLA